MKQKLLSMLRAPYMVLAVPIVLGLSLFVAAICHVPISEMTLVAAITIGTIVQLAVMSKSAPQLVSILRAVVDDKHMRFRVAAILCIGLLAAVAGSVTHSIILLLAAVACFRISGILTYRWTSNSFTHRFGARSGVRQPQLT